MNIAKTILMAVLAVAGTVALAGPKRGCPGPCGPGPHHPPPPHPHGPHHPPPPHCDRPSAGESFAAGVVGGLIGGAIANAVSQPQTTVVTTPTVVQTPTVVTTPAAVQSSTVVTAPATVTTPVVTTPAVPATQVQNVWVEGRYVDQVQANGTVVRTWTPGHYEQRSVVVQ